VGQAGGALGRALDAGQVLDGVRAAALDLLAREPGVALHREEQVVEVVRDPAREDAQALELLRLLERLLGAPALGHRAMERRLVAQPERAADQAPVAAPDRPALDAKPALVGRHAIEPALGRLRIGAELRLEPRLV
jgi:hypothetical protein